MAGSIWVQTIVAFVSAVVDSWKSPSEVTHTTTSTPVFESKDTQWSLTTIWDIVSPMLAQPTPRPVVVLGESPSAFVGLLDLAHKISPELVISFFFIGIVCTTGFSSVHYLCRSPSVDSVDDIALSTSSRTIKRFPLNVCLKRHNKCMNMCVHKILSCS